MRQNTRSRMLAFVVALLWSIPVGVTGATPVLLADQSELAFVLRQMGAPVSGRFVRFDAQLDLDSTQAEAGSVVLTVDTASATLGIPEIDAELRKPDWLASAHFPQARFTSHRIRVIDADHLEMVGTLSIKDVAHELVVPVALATVGELTTASGAVTLKRMDFQVGQGAWSDLSLVANEVQVTFKLVLRGWEKS